MNLPSIIQRELDTAPGRWRVEHGKRHLHVVVDGYLVAVLPTDGRGREAGRGDINVRAAIRRAIKGIRKGNGR